MWRRDANRSPTQGDSRDQETSQRPDRGAGSRSRRRRLRQLVLGQQRSARSSSPLVGAGSTLVAPLMSKWQSDYASKSEETVTYGAIGSGGGIDQITSRTVDFGASDAPLTEEQFEEADGEVEQIPWALSGTVPAYNVSGAPKNLKLSGEVLAGIYLGKITSWDDPAIAKLNPGASLPSTKITPVYRSDGSGDTYAFTNYLSTVSPEFKSKVGTSTTGQVPDRRRRRKERRRLRRDLARPTARSATSASPTRSPTNSACRWSKTRPGTSPNRAWKASKRPPTRSARSARTTKSRSPTCRPRPRARTRSRPTPT